MTLASAAPLRACLFGEALESLGFDALTVAVEPGIACHRSPGGATFRLPADGAIQECSLAGPDPDPSGLLGAALTTLREQGVEFDTGARFEWTETAVGRGLGEETARAVALLRGLLRHARHAASSLSDPGRLADLAVRTLRRSGSEHASRGDALAISHGGLMHLSFGFPGFATSVPTPIPGLVWIDTGAEPTIAPELEATLRESHDLIRRLVATRPSLELGRASLEEVYTALLDAGEAEREGLWSLLYLRDLTHAAARVLLERPFDAARLGELMNEHHHRLAGFGTMTARGEELRQRALEAGALGVKGVGPHRGGALLALTSDRGAALREALGAEVPVHALSSGDTPTA